ncbi:hypothetical protein C0992_009256, partial [Termitomyces sp. T32_za158]
MFGEDCRDSCGRLEHVRRGKLGLGLICSYLSKINWADGFPLDLVEVKLERLIAELKYLNEFHAEKISHTRPARRAFPTAKLTDENNLEQPTLPFQRKAVDAFREEQAQHRNNQDCEASDEATAADEEQDGQEPTKKPRFSLGNPTMVDDDGLLVDVNIQSIEEDKEKREDKRRDIDHFFREPSIRQLNGKEKSYCICKICPNMKSIVNEATTLRCHLEAYHSGKYRKWAQENRFESKLPGDIKKRKADAEHVVRTLDQDLKEKKLNERVIKYTDKAFHQAAIEWLVATDQPIQALEHSKFRHMIDVASRATDGVKIPGRKSTRASIKQSFRDHLKNLKAQLNGPMVLGEVSLTCDAWQAGNTDGYFAVTGHWIQETATMQWELKSALVGFTRLCNAHN